MTDRYTWRRAEPPKNKIEILDGPDVIAVTESAIAAEKLVEGLNVREVLLRVARVAP